MIQATDANLGIKPLEANMAISEKDIFRPTASISGTAVTTPELDAYLVHDENATVAVLTVRAEGRGQAEFTGSSKRLPGDPRNRVAAEQIALGRALIKAGSALYNAGYRNAI